MATYFGARPSDSVASGHSWSNMVSPREYQAFVNSGAGGSGSTYYDFQAWKQGQADTQRDAQQRQTVMDLAKMADPFAGQRGQYQTMLSDLLGVGGGSTAAPAATFQGGMRLGGPAATAPAATAQAAGAGTSRIADLLGKNPFFQANMDAGNDAAMRRLRQMGMGDSGNAAFELQKQAQSDMSGEYWRMADLLGKVSGAYADPASGANTALKTMGLFENQRQFNVANAPRFGGGAVSTGVQSVPGASRMSDIGNYWGGQSDVDQLRQKNLQEDARKRVARDYYDRFGGFAP